MPLSQRAPQHPLARHAWAVPLTRHISPMLTTPWLNYREGLATKQSGEYELLLLRHTTAHRSLNFQLRRLGEYAEPRQHGRY